MTCCTGLNSRSPFWIHAQAPVTQLAASLPHQEPERLSLEVSTPEPSSASRPPPAPLPQRKQHPRRARASAARVAELRTSSHSAWGKSIKPDPEEPQAAAPKRGRVPRGKGRTAGKKSEAKDQPFQIMFKDHNQLVGSLAALLTSLAPVCPVCSHCAPHSARRTTTAVFLLVLATLLGEPLLSVM